MSLDIIGDRIVIVRGEDKSPIIDIRNQKSGRPIDLTGATKVTVIFIKGNRTKLELSTVEIPATQSKATYKGVTFTTVNAGAITNGVELVFNGTLNVGEVVNGWNSANPTNQITYSGATSSDVLPTGNVILEGGYNNYSPVSIVDERLGIIQVTLTDTNTKALKIGEGQDFTIQIDFGLPSGGTRMKGIFRRLDVVE